MYRILTPNIIFPMLCCCSNMVLFYLQVSVVAVLSYPRNCEWYYICNLRNCFNCVSSTFGHFSSTIRVWSEKCFLQISFSTRLPIPKKICPKLHVESTQPDPNAPVTSLYWFIELLWSLCPSWGMKIFHNSTYLSCNSELREWSRTYLSALESTIMIEIILNFINGLK